MPDPLFFFSHAAANRDPYLKRLFDDLSRTVRFRYAGHPTDEPGFMASDVALGDEWRSYGDALRTCRTFVALLSPAYFQSEQCGREWALFRRRVEAADNDDARIVPVIWVPPAVQTFPPAVTPLVDRVELGLSDEYSSKGLLFLMRRGRPEYEAAVDALARGILAQASKAPLPWLSELPSVREVKSAFADFASPSTPKSIVVVPMAGSRADVSSVRRFVESYGLLPGRDWRPFFPPLDEGIESLARNVAAQEGYSCEQVVPAPDLADRVAQSGRKNQPVIVLLDSWAAMLPTYRDTLTQLGDRVSPHVDFLILENGNDQETSEHRQALDSAVRRTLEKLARTRTGRFETARTVDEFKLHFSQTLVGILGRMVRIGEPVRRLPTTIALPTIGGPGESRR